MPGRSKLLTYGLPVVGIAALVGGTVLVAINRPVAAEESPPRTPTQAPDSVSSTGKPLGGGSSSFIGAIGVTEPPFEAINIASEVPGIATDVVVRVGDDVAAGSVLFRVDARQAEARVAVQRSQLEVALADHESLRGQIPTRRAELEAADAAVRSAEAAVDAAEADAADMQNQKRVAESVKDTRAIASEEVERRRFAAMQAEARATVAEAAVKEAEAARLAAVAMLSLLEAEEGSAGPELIAAEQRVRRAKADLTAAETDLERLTVRAPVDAEVLQVNLRPGEYASASSASTGDALLVLGRTGKPHLRVEIDEVDIARFSRNANAWASPRGNADLQLPLELVYVEPLVVPKTNLAGRTSELIDTRVLQAVYTFVSPPALLGLGQQFDVYIATANLADDATETSSQENQ